MEIRFELGMNERPPSDTAKTIFIALRVCKPPTQSYYTKSAGSKLSFQGLKQSTKSEICTLDR